MRWQTREHYETYRAWREETGDVKRFADVTESGLSVRPLPMATSLSQAFLELEPWTFF
jgi:hypothetical protein